MNGLEQLITNNGPAVATVGIFIWYLSKRDNLNQQLYEKLGEKLDRLSEVILCIKADMHVRSKSKDE